MEELFPNVVIQKSNDRNTKNIFSIVYVKFWIVTLITKIDEENI